MIDNFPKINTYKERIEFLEKANKKTGVIDWMIIFVLILICVLFYAIFQYNDLDNDSNSDVVFECYNTLDDKVCFFETGEMKITISQFSTITINNGD